MTQIAHIRTAAEARLVEAFAGLRRGHDAVAARREAAFARFEASGLPHRRLEDWKYTDLRSLIRDMPPLAGTPGAAARAQAKSAGRTFAAIAARRLVFHDGAFLPELSDLQGLEPGLQITSLADALVSGGAAERLGAAGPAEDDVAYALNTAFMADGAIIEVAAGHEIARPLHFVNVYGARRAVFARSCVTIGRGGALTLLETHEGGTDCQVNTALDVAVGDHARFDRVCVNAEGAAALHLATVSATIGADAQVADFAFLTGGEVVRNQLFAICNGAGTSLSLGGASLLKGRQHADTTLKVDHAAPGCRSRELFKSVLDEHARGVFQGKIMVRPQAQKTDARMMARALLLCADAEADNKPELEIFADDVQCGHGATCGALDPDLKFYLMSRGISEPQAEALLIESFIGEAVDTVGHAGVREALAAATQRWLAGRPGRPPAGRPLAAGRQIAGRP